MQQIGTKAEKSTVEKELVELRERLAKVEEWKKRRQEIEDELNKVWVSGGNELPPPAYIEKEDISSTTASPSGGGLGASQTSFISGESGEVV